MSSTTTPKVLNKTKSFVPWQFPSDNDANSTTTAFVRANPHVPTGNNDATTTTTGRTTMYEPVLAFSPVYTSQRHQGGDNNNNQRGLISNLQVQDLVQSLHAMWTGGDDKAKENDDEEKEEKKQDDNHDATPNAGRYEHSVFSQKAQGTVTVKRSRRFLSSSSDP